MKKESFFKGTALAALLAGAAVLSGCSTNDVSFSPTTRPQSQLAFSPVTAPDLLITWSRDYPNMRSIDTYYLVVPAESDDVVVRSEFDVDTESGAAFYEAAGSVPPGYRLIRHTPNQR
jgi:hypothetical protein